MMNWNNDELMVETYRDMRVACSEETMYQLKKQGWQVLNLYRMGGQRRYTMVLPERSSEGYAFTEVNAIERFRDIVRRVDRPVQRPVLRRVS